MIKGTKEGNKMIPEIDTFVCPYHICYTEKGWCWECAVETYGYEEALKVHEGR